MSLIVWMRTGCRCQTTPFRVANWTRAAQLAASLLVASIVPAVADPRTAIDATSVPSNQFADGTRSLSDFRFTSGFEAIVPVSVEAGAIILEVNFNGRGPLPMMFDTGARSAVTPETAAALGLTTEATTATFQDSGDRTLPVGLTRFATVGLGNLELADQPFAVVSLPPYLTDRGTTRPPLAGVIGSELLERLAVRLDYDHGTLTLISGADFRYQGNGARLPLALIGNLPAVPAAADGIEGRFAIDTGSTGALTLRREFVEEHHLEDRHPTALRIKSIGVGGPFEALLTRLDNFDVAGSRVESPATRFPAGGEQEHELAGFDGVVGYEILRQFSITFDCAHLGLWFEHSSAFGTRTGGRSAGFQAIRIGGAGFRVITILPNTAAAAAGIRVGDLITDINGRSTIPMSLGEFAELMRKPGEVSVHLGLSRDGAAVAVAIDLKDTL
jgi:hypothetical protein